jgi:hypothetical protein
MQLTGDQPAVVVVRCHPESTSGSVPNIVDGLYVLMNHILAAGDVSQPHVLFAYLHLDHGVAREFQVWQSWELEESGKIRKFPSGGLRKIS